MKNFYKMIILGAIVINFSCSGSGEQNTQNEEVIKPAEDEPAISSEQSKKVIEHHLAAFGENDLASVMTDYSNESIIITPDSTYTGLEQIESFFVGLFPAFPTEGTTIELDKMVIEDELAYIVWHGKTPTVEVTLGTDTFIIEGNKIKRQTFAGVINPIE